MILLLYYIIIIIIYRVDSNAIHSILCYAYNYLCAYNDLCAYDFFKGEVCLYYYLI
jgi:hypothetical protein